MCLDQSSCLQHNALDAVVLAEKELSASVKCNKWFV